MINQLFLTVYINLDTLKWIQLTKEVQTFWSSAKRDFVKKTANQDWVQ